MHVGNIIKYLVTNSKDRRKVSNNNLIKPFNRKCLKKPWTVLDEIADPIEASWSDC